MVKMAAVYLGITYRDVSPHNYSFAYFLLDFKSVDFTVKKHFSQRENQQNHKNKGRFIRTPRRRSHLSQPFLLEDNSHIHV